jgi:hypothetical protein
MQYLIEVVEENYKVYDSNAKGVFVVDAKYLKSNTVLGVVSGVTYTPFTKRELKLANLLELISDKDFKKYSKSRFPVFWTADLSTWVCYDNTGRDSYRNLVNLIVDIFINHQRAYSIHNELLEIYLFERVLTFKIKDIEKFELLKTKIITLTKQ